MQQCPLKACLPILQAMQMQHLDCMRVLLLVAKKPCVSGLRLPAHADAAPQLYAHAAAHCLEACMCCFQQLPAVRAATALRV